MPSAKAVDTSDAGTEQLAFLVLPLRTFQYLSTEAAKRNQTLPQFICNAVDAYLVQTNTSPTQE